MSNTSSNSNPNSQVGGILQSMPIQQLIATPLIAAAQCQKDLATVTAGFIKDVGLNSADPSNPNSVFNARTVDFQYQDGNITKKITAPILAIVNIPSLQVQDVNVRFTVKVDAMADTSTQSNSSSSLNTNTSASASGSYWFAKASFSTNIKTSATLSSSSKSNSSLSTSATYDVNVSARNEKPEGLMKLLDILKDTITNQEASSSTTTSSSSSTTPSTTPSTTTP